MEKKKSASEILACKYADIFVELFDRIPDSPQDPFLVPSPYPQQNMSGNVYSGRNGLLTSLVASSKGYEFPVWLTFNQVRETGLCVNAGEHGTPIAVYRFVLYDKESGQKSDLTEDEYRLLSKEEKQKYEVKAFLRAPWSVFNLSQTNFKEVCPDQYEQLVSMISGPQPNHVTEELVDRMVASDSWQCPIRVNENLLQPYYSMEKDLIASPPKEAFVDNAAYYSSMLYMMSQSTFHPDRYDKKVDDVMLRLSSQLSSAMLGSLLGVQTRVNHDNLSYMKRWSTEISSDPMVIYRAVNDAVTSSNAVSRVLGIGVRKGVDFSGVMGEAQKMLEEARDSNKKRSSKSFKPRKFKLNR